MVKLRAFAVTSKCVSVVIPIIFILKRYNYNNIVACTFHNQSFPGSLLLEAAWAEPRAPTSLPTSPLSLPHRCLGNGVSPMRKLQARTVAVSLFNGWFRCFGEWIHLSPIGSRVVRSTHLADGREGLGSRLVL